MIKIGEFSTLTGISIHMLRNYDKIGLLVPACTDECSGYRYYKEEQIPVANQIVVLKNFGFGLKEITEILHTYQSPEKIQLFLQDKMQEKLLEIAIAKEQMQKMQQAVQEIAKEDLRSLSVTVKHIPARIVISLRGIIHKFEDEGLLWNDLKNICNQLQIKQTLSEYSFAITHRIEFCQAPSPANQSNRVSEIDVEVQKVIEALPSAKITASASMLCKRNHTLQFLQFPSCEVAALAFRGSYNQIGDINAYMNEWINKNHYKQSGSPFVTYFLSPGNEQNPENFITEACFPIVKL